MTKTFEAVEAGQRIARIVNDAIASSDRRDAQCAALIIRFYRDHPARVIGGLVPDKEGRFQTSKHRDVRESYLGEIRTGDQSQGKKLFSNAVSLAKFVVKEHPHLLTDDKVKVAVIDEACRDNATKCRRAGKGKSSGSGKANTEPQANTSQDKPMTREELRANLEAPMAKDATTAPSADAATAPNADAVSLNETEFEALKSLLALCNPEQLRTAHAVITDRLEGQKKAAS